jgi:DNA adenine methylase
MKAPFPWFGGKSRAADIIWPRLGNVPNYVEPFCGSCAVLLARPHAPGNEIVNDRDAYVANAWRAMKMGGGEVAEMCDWPVNESDLHARHRWLHGRAEFRERMANDPELYDARIAAWWIWGLSCWIGDNFCRPRAQAATPHLSGGKGVARQIPHLSGGMGVDHDVPDQIPNIVGTYNARTSHRGQPNGKGVAKFQADALETWFAILEERLRFTKVCCGDWSRVVTKAATWGQGLTGVLLDPPYDTDGHGDVYGELSRGVSAPVRAWAIENGENPLLRIALCGYESEHEMPATWECVAWKAAGGYGSQSGNQNANRERIWFSPHCLRPELDLFAEAS